MSLLNAISVDAMRACGVITEAEVAALRAAFNARDSITREEAEALISLNAACTNRASGWSDCFVELVSDYAINQLQPAGYVTVDNAEWLVAEIAGSGRIESKTEFELLIDVLDKARWSPEGLVAFALDQVKAAVVTGEGPLRAGTSLPAGVIDEAEVELIKRILYAFGGDGNVPLSRSEADILFDIDMVTSGKEATSGNENAESWPDLFVKAIANCIMTASGYAAPSREQALARETWIERRAEQVHASANVLSTYRAQSPVERAIAALERQKIEIVTADEVTVADAGWLAERIGTDGRSPNIGALITFVGAQNPQLAPELEQLMLHLRQHAA